MHVPQELEGWLIGALVDLAQGLDQGEGLFVEFGEQLEDGLDLVAEPIDGRLRDRFDGRFGAGFGGNPWGIAQTKQTSENPNI